jgi:hypothetical protein
MTLSSPDNPEPLQAAASKLTIAMTQMIDSALIPIDFSP